MDLEHHPCFHAKVKGKYGRVHLPVAPRCNIKCNYCNRKYDCVNESRPGVTSRVVSPGQAVEYLKIVLEKEPRIKVAGIAGPGDPFANPEATMETLELAREQFPDLILCLATNGLELSPYIDRLAELNVTNVTVTVNAVDPVVGARIYAWVRDGNVVYRKEKGAELLLGRQLEAIRELKEHGITVKVNTILVPGKNDEHMIDVARTMGGLGVDLLNCIPMFPTPGSPFEEIAEPSKKLVSTIRNEAEKYVPQMRHCARCRADAVGLLAHDRIDEFRRYLTSCAALPIGPKERRPCVAVASREGMLVNQHLGEADRFLIYTEGKDRFNLVDTRLAPTPGTGRKRWVDLAETLNDCRAILVGALGETPKTILEQAGIQPVEMYGFIEEGLSAIYEGRDVRSLKGRRVSCTDATGCTGTGLGCG
jgi:nitrogen fixation protein NifB